VVALLADEGNRVRDCNAKLLRAVAREKQEGGGAAKQGRER
jgi:hypothetical protein